MRCVKSYDQNLTAEKSLTFSLRVDCCFEVAVVGLLSTGLELIWNRRLEKKNTDNIVLRSMEKKLTVMA